MRLVMSAVLLAAVIGAFIVTATLMWRKPRLDRRQAFMPWIKHRSMALLVTVLAIVVTYGVSATAMNSIIYDADKRTPKIPAAVERELQDDAAEYFSTARHNVYVASYGNEPGTKSGAYVAVIDTYYGGRLVTVLARKVFQVNDDHWSFGCNVPPRVEPSGVKPDVKLIFTSLDDPALAKAFARSWGCPLPANVEDRF